MRKDYTREAALMRKRIVNGLREAIIDDKSPASEWIMHIGRGFLAPRRPARSE